jgi:hypothetical protein
MIGSSMLDYHGEGLEQRAAALANWASEVTPAGHDAADWLGTHAERATHLACQARGEAAVLDRAVRIVRDALRQSEVTHLIDSDDVELLDLLDDDGQRAPNPAQALVIIDEARRLERAGA